MLQKIGNFSIDGKYKKQVNGNAGNKNTEKNTASSKFVSSFHRAEIRIIKFEEITQAEIKKKIELNKNRAPGAQHSIKQLNICITGLSKGENRENGT